MHNTRTYDPRYNAKIYVPKLTEEQRRARATPVESLRRPRAASAAVAEPVVQSVPASQTVPAPQASRASNGVTVHREVPCDRSVAPSPQRRVAADPELNPRRVANATHRAAPRAGKVALTAASSGLWSAVMPVPQTRVGLASAAPRQSLSDSDPVPRRGYTGSGFRPPLSKRGTVPSGY